MSSTDRGLLWRLLPVLKSRDLGKLGPAFGYGIGCGAGIGVGLIGGLCVFLFYLSTLILHICTWFLRDVNHYCLDLN